MRVCAGVQHAHQRAILHRDLKPSNVLVRMVDATLAPTIIDFGIAKALQEPLTGRPLQTEYGAIVGTPEHMSAERLRGAEAPPDTRADVYALGTILCELLVGSLPHESGESRSRSTATATARSHDRPPAAPSTLLHRSPNADEVALRRTTDADGMLLKVLLRRGQGQAALPMA